MSVCSVKQFTSLEAGDEVFGSQETHLRIGGTCYLKYFCCRLNLNVLTAKFDGGDSGKDP